VAMTAPASPVRVLIVDDDAESREVLRRALAFDRGIQVVGEADSGPRAVEQAHALRPDVVLMDVRMPDGDGVEATERITSRLTRVQVIALTAHDDHASVKDMLTAGASGYLIKGAPVDEVMSAIRRAGAGESPVDRRVLPHVLEELRAHLQQERQRRAEAERLARTREEFLQVLSHELRTPLTVIGGTLQYLERRGADQEAQELLQAAKGRVSDLERMVEGLELIGQGPAGPDVAADPAEAVGRALARLSQQPDEVHIEADLWPGVRHQHLSRVVLELTANALRHGQPPVMVRTSREAGTGLIEVSDAGGFEPEPRLFGPFVQGDMSISRIRGGFGLGLFVAARLCELGGGRLDLHRQGHRTVALARFRLTR
jgi:DNA-binding NarL/FixJ family response regulator/anti-sigma regulatory factor (Ser/Thr protein kinase)